MGTAGTISDRRHRWGVMRQYRYKAIYQCAACHLRVSTFTTEGMRRLANRMNRIVRKAFLPNIIKQIYSPRPLWRRFLEGP